MTDNEGAKGELHARIGKAVNIIGAFGRTEGADHKQWILDQVLRALMTPEEYSRFLQIEEDWDQGVAP